MNLNEPLPERVMEIYQAALALAVAGLAAALAIHHGDVGSVPAVLALALAAGVAERGRVKLGTFVEASISLLPTVFAAAVFGPLAAMIVGAASFSGEFPPLLGKSRRDEVLARGRPYL